MGKNIAVIGAGSWGTALAILLAQNGHQVKMWSRFSDEVNMINEMKEHTSKLPGVKIPDNVTCTDDVEYALKDASAAVMVVPSQTVRENAKLISKYISKDCIVVCCSKGLEEGTGLRLSEVISKEIPENRVAVLSGPSHAEEVGNSIPTAIVAASEHKEAAEFVQDIFMSPNFRVYTSNDIVGVELGAALKNVIALCAGISDGLGFGDNTKAALMTRGILEISRMGIAMGAKPETFSGLTGIGDLIVTCTSMHSRNRRAGILIGQGKSVKEAVQEVKMVVEGITTAKAAFELSSKVGVSTPIIDEAYDILFKNKDARKAVWDLMMRDKKSEMTNTDVEDIF